MFQYRYIRLLGEGTNGKTYLAERLSTGTRVAIKALKLVQSENFKSFELFKREAETLSSLQVPGVPKFYESILSDALGGECYIIQEYVDAPSIQSYLAQGRIFTESETLALMESICEILHLLHTQYSPPVIHRDIKPSNILCDMPAPDSAAAQDKRQPYLIDFGAVANAHSNSDKSTIAGTIGYMAPEQNFGECLPQADLYALGATALHMLTGVAPYEMDFDTYAIQYNAALDAHAPQTSAHMRDFLGCLLNYSYDKRPASAAEAHAMIRNLRAGNPMDDASAPVKPRKRNILETIRTIIRNLVFNITPKAEDYFAAIDPLSALFRLDHVRLSPGTVQSRTGTTKLEYTFEAEDMTWSGVTNVPIRKIAFRSDQSLADMCANALKADSDWLKDLNALKLPATCIVCYHPKDPSINKILFIDRAAISEPEPQPVMPYAPIITPDNTNQRKRDSKCQKKGPDRKKNKYSQSQAGQRHD